MRKDISNLLGLFTRISLYAWLGTLVVFGILIAWPNGYTSAGIMKEPRSTILLIDVLTGVGAFLLLILFSFIAVITKAKPQEVPVEEIKETPKKRRKKEEKSGVNGFLIAVIVVLLVLLAYNFGMSASDTKKSQDALDANTVSLTPTPIVVTPTQKPVLGASTSKNTSTNSNSIDCIGPDGKEFKTSEAECKKLNESWGKPMDYMVNCNVNSNCGGGTRMIKKSECDNSVCCQIGSSWIFYTSKDKCNQDQNSHSSQTTQTSSGNNVYCWNNTYNYGYYTSSGDQCNLDNLESGTYKICMNTQKMKSDTCSSVCKSEENKNSDACAWAYTGPNAGIEQNPDLYGECLNGPGGAGDLYGECLGKCTDQYAQDIKQCSN